MKQKDWEYPVKSIFMEKIRVKITRGKDLLSAISDMPYIYGEGANVGETKASFLESIRLFKEYNPADAWPDAVKGEYEIIWEYDIATLLEAYKGIITPPAIGKLTGINAKIIHHYAMGLKHPRPERRKKIEAALHKLGSELLTTAVS